MTRIAACVATLFLSACAGASYRGSSCQSVRVMTWNIAAGHGNIAQIAEEIRKSHPDIIALQEVDVHWSDRSAFVDQADSLAKSLAVQFRFAPIYNIPDSSGAKLPRQFGVAILSRYPITSWKNHEITRLSTQQANATPALAPGFLETVIDAPTGPLRMFSTHLDYRGDPSVRTRQVLEMVNVIGKSKLPVILSGDLNATPEALELKPLWFLHDAGAARGLMTYPADKPAKRIDYILVSDGLVATGAEVPVTLASDHRPVLSSVGSSRSCPR